MHIGRINTTMIYLSSDREPREKDKSMSVGDMRRATKAHKSLSDTVGHRLIAQVSLPPKSGLRNYAIRTHCSSAFTGNGGRILTSAHTKLVPRPSASESFRFQADHSKRKGWRSRVAKGDHKGRVVYGRCARKRR